MPLIAFLILIPMGLARFAVGGVDLSLAWGFAVAVLAYYLSRDLQAEVERFAPGAERS